MSSELQCTVCSLEPPETSKVFPYPHKDSELFRLWKRSAGKPENWQPDSTDGFCKIHFSDDQFVSSKVSDAALKLTPKAIPKINLGMCFVCYQNQVSWQGFALTDKSEHSDKTLFQIFEQVMKSKIIIPSVRLCPDCDAGMNEFDFLITEAENIQKKFQGLLQQRTKSIGNNTNINKSTITTSAAPAPLPAQKIDTIDLLSDDEQELSESDPVADEDDALEEKSQSDSDTDSSDEKMLDESSNDVMIDFEEQLSELNKVPTVDPSSMITEEKCSYNETYYDMKDVDMTDCRSETVQAFQVTNAPSTSNECPPKVVIGLNPKVTFKLLECLKCSKVYNSQRAFEIHKKMHDIKANFLPCERCNRPINLQFYVTHTMTCLGYDPDFLKCVVSNCGIHFKFVEDLAEHLRKHKADPNFLSVVNAQSTLDGEPSILGKEKNPPATKIKPTIILKNKPKKRPKKYDCKNLPSRKRYPCEKCGKGFALGYAMGLHMLSHEKDHLEPPKKRTRFRRKFKKNGEPYKIKLYTCPICERPNFKMTKSLKEHIATHDPNYGFLCPYCKKKYRHAPNVKFHIVRRHPQYYEAPNVFKCSECEFQCNKHELLGPHMDEVHPNSIDNEKTNDESEN